MQADVLQSCRRLVITVTVLAATVGIGAGMTGSALARDTHGQTTSPRASHGRGRIAVAAPCASQGSCKHCGRGGVGTGNCTRAKLEYNLAWCGGHKNHLRLANKGKCRADARYLSWGPADQILPWINVICAPANARTIYLVVKGLTTKSGVVGVACAGIAVYEGLHSLLFEIA